MMKSTVSVANMPLTGKEVVFSKKNKRIADFLNIKDVAKVTAETCGRSKITYIGKDLVLNINDEAKIELASVLLDRWMHCQVGNDSVYVKHVASNRTNVLYQIMLSGQCWDGIYEMSLKSKQIQVKGYIINDRHILSIQSNGNYNVAMFGGVGEEPHSIIRMDYSSDEEFKQALINTGLIESDLDIYFKPDSRVKPYLNKVLPNIVLE